MIRVQGKTKYERLATDEDDIGLDRKIGVEGTSNRIIDDSSRVLPQAGAASGAVRPRRRKTSRDELDENAESTSGESRILLQNAKKEAEMMELSEMMIQTEGNQCKNLSREPGDFFEIEVQEGDTLQGLALKFGCPVQEIKRANNMYSNQEIHSLRRLRVPMKKHGLLSELFAHDAKRRRSGNSGRNASAGRAGAREEVVDVVEDVEDESENSDQLVEENDSSAFVCNPPHTSVNSIRELENLFPYRNLTDCESASDSRRDSLAGSESDSNSPLIRTFYLSIRENLSSSSVSGRQARQASRFLSKMDADLTRIRDSNSSSKNSLEEVADSLTSTRIRPLGAPPDREGDIHGTLLGMNWWMLLLISAAVFLLLLFTFYTYAKRQAKGVDTNSTSPTHFTPHSTK